MESTVINQPQESPNPTGSNNTSAQSHVGGDQHSSTASGPGQQPQQESNDDHRFRSGHNPFFFDMDDPRDFFTNPALRTRLSRFQNPWNSSFGQQRKRRTSPPSSGGASEQHSRDPYNDDFFHSHFDAPHWNEPRGWPPMNGGRMRMQEPKGNADMFNYIPEEFRKYMPEQFGFPHHQPPHHRQSSVHTQSQPQTPQAQQSYNRNNSGDLRRPKYCDAGMQTDDVSPSESAANINESEAKAQQHQQSEVPPRATPPAGEQNQQSGFARSFADTGVGNSPNASFASAHAYASSGDGEGQRQTRSNSNSMGNVRRVPIVVEGTPSSFPKESYMPHRQPPNRQNVPPQPQPQADAPKRPPPPTAREVPIQRPAEPPSPSVVSINKIQDIQQDVLDLMFKVEQYKGGSKEDKEYKYLDEMLTRNLLKLDTIDTRGNDSIRLARKEAIKCIQASLNVLEAKVDGRPQEEGTGLDDSAEGDVDATEKVPEQSTATTKGADEGAAEEHQKTDIASVASPDPSMEVDTSKIAIPMPPIPGQVPEPTIRDCNSDEEGDTPVFVSEKKVELKGKSS